MTSRETAPRFAGIGGHHSAKSGTVEWATPHDLPGKLGTFGIDPCAPIDYPVRIAARFLTVLDDGLLLPWVDEDGAKLRAWLNPPYANGEIEKWLAKMALHDFGTALIFARTETEAFYRHVFCSASALLFMRGRINFNVIEPFSVVRSRRTFLTGERMSGNAGAPTVLCAYGALDAEMLSAADVDGKFVPLVFARFVRGGEVEAATWRELVERVLREAGGEPVQVADVWRAVEGHPKATGKKHGRAKVRQVLQKIGERVDRGQYRLSV